MSADALERHVGFVRRIACGLLADRDQAEDVCQATMAEALARPPRHAGNLKGWLGTVARRLALRRRAREAQRRSRERRAARSEAVGPADEAVAKMEVVRRIAATVTSLDEPYRTTVIERYYHDRQPAEIARRTGVPVATVKTRLRRALTMLRGRLDRQTRHWAVILGPLAWPRGAAATGMATMAGKKTLALAAALAAGALGVVWGVARGSGEDAASSGRGRAAARADAVRADDSNARHPMGAKAPNPGARHVFAGHVVDERGAPVAGARVELLYATEPDPTAHLLSVLVRRAREIRFVPSVATDARGAFRFERPYASRSFLRVRAAGHGVRVSGLHEPGEGIELVLRSERRLRVRVVDDGGEPVVGASVALESIPPPGAIARGAVGAGGAIVVERIRPTADGVRHALDEATTDAKGEVVLARPPLPGLGLFVSPSEPHLGTIGRACPSDEDAIEVVLPRLNPHRVRIVDAETGAAVPSARIIAVPDSRALVGPRRRVVEADADGRVDEPWQEDWRPFATAPGYEIKFAGGAPIRLRRAMRVDGTVVDPAGSPVAGAPVLVALESDVTARADAGLPLVAAWTDAEGRFGFDLTMITPDNLPVPPDPGVRTLVALDPRFPPARRRGRGTRDRPRRGRLAGAGRAGRLAGARRAAVGRRLALFRRVGLVDRRRAGRLVRDPRPDAWPVAYAHRIAAGRPRLHRPRHEGDRRPARRDDDRGAGRAPLAWTVARSFEFLSRHRIQRLGRGTRMRS